jgi:hypothetical protein
MMIRRKQGMVTLESKQIIWASATVGYCASCRKTTAYEFRGPAVMIDKLKGNLGQVGLIAGASALSCPACAKVVNRALELVKGNRLAVTNGRVVIKEEENG